MLSSIHIENIAVIKRLDLDLECGFNVLTGETGAGKSILIDSINFLLGKKAARELIRSGAENAKVYATFADINAETEMLLDEMGIEKIKTIGDCYMAISGIRDDSENNALKIIEFARGLLQDVKEFNKTSKYKFDIRIGINSGEVVAGVIGKIKFIYDVWGDTVNIASRMEALSKPGCIHVSEHTYDLTKNLVAYTEVETQNVNGKGEMKTYFVQI